MVNRGRGRPKKIPSPNRDGGNSVVKSSGDDFPEFFIIYVPALYSEIMKIPPAFIKKIGGNVPATVTIRSPSGQSWEVATVKINEHWFLEKGWPEFVQENSLEMGDFLTFGYDGNSIFSVQIFATNGCRKEFNSTSSDNGKQTEILSDDEPEPEDLKHTRRTLRPRSSRARISRGRNPSFTVDMSKYCLTTSRLHIPKEFSDAYVKKDGCSSRAAALELNNKLWHVGLMKVVDRMLFSGGWIKFVKDNSLRRGNSCTFQLVDKDLFIFKVTISR